MISMHAWGLGIFCLVSVAFVLYIDGTVQHVDPAQPHARSSAADKQRKQTATAQRCSHLLGFTDKSLDTLLGSPSPR